MKAILKNTEQVDMNTEQNCVGMVALFVGEWQLWGSYSMGFD